MKRVTALFLAAVLLLSLAACGGKDPWQEQYDLGMRYLNEGNYQEAIIAFEAAIEIDPKRVEAYSGLSNTYMAMGEYVATIFENFEPNAMLKADELEVYLVRGLNTIKNLYKMGKSKKEIDKVKNQIIEKAIEDEVFRL